MLIWACRGDGRPSDPDILQRLRSAGPGRPFRHSRPGSQADPLHHEVRPGEPGQRPGRPGLGLSRRLPERLQVPSGRSGSESQLVGPPERYGQKCRLRKAWSSPRARFKPWSAKKTITLPVGKYKPPIPAITVARIHSMLKPSRALAVFTSRPMWIATPKWPLNCIPPRRPLPPQISQTIKCCRS